MTKDEALKLALQALEANHFLIHGSETKGGLAFCMDGYYSGCFDIDSNDKQTNKAITAIKEALAQPEHGWTPERIAGMARLKEAQDKKLAQLEQEPVTWRYKIVDVFGRPAWTLKTPKSDTRVLESQPLYTTPPQRTWVGLTLDERIELAQDVDWAIGAYCEYAEKIEAKLKEKNNG